MLLERPGEVVTREELRKKLWSDDTFVDFDQGLNRAINKIREALADDPETPRYVETLPRRGYRFIAPIEPRPSHAGEVPAPAPAPPRSARRLPAVVWVVIGLALVGAATASYFLMHRARSIDSVAILPFANPSADPTTHELCDGLTESLILNLSQLPDLKVTSYSAVSRYRGQPTDPQAAGRQLGVQAVLTGRVIQHGDVLDIRMELVGVRDNRHIWGGQYEGKVTDILMVQEQVSREIADNLRLRLSGEDAKRLEAYSLYLKGRSYWNQRTLEGLNKSVEYFQQAIAKDPKHALAYAGLADSYNMLARYGALPPREAFPKAEAAAQKALALDSNLAEAHTALAFVKQRYEWDWPGAEAEFRRAIALNTQYAPAHQWYASFLAGMGRDEEAVAEATEARKLDPLSLVTNTHLAWVLYMAHQPRQAIQQCQATLQLDPDFFVARRYLGLSYALAGSFDRAVTELRKAAVLSGNSPLMRAELAYAYARSGKKGEAQKLLAELTGPSRGEYTSPYFVAVIYTGLGDKQQALAWLEKAFAEHTDEMVYLKADPKFDPLRSDPRFQDLLRRMNFTP
jgi:TolB-like protein/Tfp pilus assembly protein PilF